MQIELMFFICHFYDVKVYFEWNEILVFFSMVVQALGGTP